MKKTIYAIFLALAAVLALSHCTSPKSLLQKGDYYRAAISAIQKLRSSPNNANAQSVLVQAYPLAVQTAQRTIANSQLRNDVAKYDDIILLYSQLNDLANQIYTSPKAYELVPRPQEFISELEQAKITAAEQFYNQGIKALNNNTIEQARLAYSYFTRANYYFPGYRDVLQKIANAYFYSTLHVVVLPPQTPARFQVSADFFYNNLISEMTRQNQYKFVRFYTPEEAKNEGMSSPNQYIILDFVDFTVGNIRETSNTRDMSRDSVVTGTVDVGGKKYNAYATVKAKYTEYRREIISGGKMSVRIAEGSNQRIVEQRAFDGSYTWTTVWAKFTGDDRALTAEQKRNVQQEAKLPPPNQDLFVEFTRPIYSQAVSYIRTFYNRYNVAPEINNAGYFRK